MTFTVWHWILVLLVFLLLFGGRGKISELVRQRRLDPLMAVAMVLLVALAVEVARRSL
jgi:hypothetical protein